MNGQTPGTDADKGPKKSIAQQFKDKLEARGIAPPEGDLTVSGDSPFQAATEAEIAAERGTTTTEAPITGGTTDANQTQAGADGAATGADAGTAPGTEGAEPQASGGDSVPGTAGGAAAGAVSGGNAGAVPAGAAVVDSATGAAVGAGAAGAAEPEYVDVEIDDPDAGRTIKARVPKDYAEPAKGGWLRRADYTRKTQFLSKYKPTLEPLIASGEMEYVEPLIRLATTNAPFAQAVVELAQQAMSGQPLRYGAAAPAGTPPAPAGTQPAGGTQPAAALQGIDVKGALAQIAAANPNLDPITLEALETALPGLLGPVLTRLDSVTQRLSQEDQQREQARQTQAQQAQKAEENQRFALEARALFVQAFPGEFTGTDADFQKLGEVYEYAQRSGLIAQHGRLNGLFAAKRAMDAAKAEYTPSAAAAGVAQRTTLDEIQARAAQRSAAEAVAAGLGGGAAGGAAAAAAPTGGVALKGAQLRDPKTGKLLPTNVILRKVAEANQHLVS